MKLPPDDIVQRVLYVLHLGLSDLRYLAKAGKTEQAYDLGDTLENIPGFLVQWEDGHLERIKMQFQNYRAKYGEACWCEYAKYLEDERAPDRF